MSRVGQVLKQGQRLTSLQKALEQGVCDRTSQSGISGALHQTRQLGGGVPEFFGRPSHYTEGTNFLGTPEDHLELTKKRPLSPDVMEIDGRHLHYKFPINALSSIATRATGCALSVGMIGAGAVALTGDLPAAVESLRDSAPGLMLPLKGLIAFPLVYHYAAGFRHLVWDKHSIGNQADKNSLLENPKVDLSSKIIVGVGAVGTVGLALLTVG